MSRRKRRLTPEESELWNSVARTAKRLGKPQSDPAPDILPSEASQPAPLVRRPALQPSVVPATISPRQKPEVTVDFAPDPLAVAGAAPPRIDRRRFERMRRGKLEPEARIDLHGMTRDAAHSALTGFVLSAQGQGLRLVLVITGKGRPDLSDAIIPERRGILRHSLTHWLNAPPLAGRVLEVRPAHQRHGGSGAVYLYLRKHR